MLIYIIFLLLVLGKSNFLEFPWYLIMLLEKEEKK